MKRIWKLLSGGSDPRDRQTEAIVPGLRGSGRSDESNDGLPTLLAASSGGELAIDGTVSTCSAGVLTLNAPAKDLGRDQEGKWGEPVRLKGGAGGGSDEESISSQELTVMRKGMVVVEGNAKVVSQTIGGLHSDTEKEKEESVRRREKERDREDLQVRTCRKRRREKSSRPAKGQGKDSDSDSGEDPDEVRGGSSGNEGRSRSATRDKRDTEGEEVTEVRPNLRCSSLDRPKKNKGPGRPPTTGDYVKLWKEQDRLNEKMRERNRLIYEEKILRMTGKEMMEATKMKEEDLRTEMEHQPTGDLVNRLREAQMSILQVEKSSGNLKGTHQSALKVAAITTLAILETLRNRADGNGSEEVKILQRRQKESEELLKDMQENKRKQEEKLEEMRGKVEEALITAETERRKAERYRNQLEVTVQKREELERQLQMSCWEPVTAPEPMEVGEAVTMEPLVTKRGIEVEREGMEERKEEGTPPPDTLDTKITTKEEMERYPWIRPARKGIEEVLRDEPIPGKPRKNRRMQKGRHSNDGKRGRTTGRHTDHKEGR